MKRFVLSILLGLFFFPLYAIDSYETNVQPQQADQLRCSEDRLNQCIEKCLRNRGSDCKSLCQENVKNECREAGE